MNCRPIRDTQKASKRRIWIWIIIANLLTDISAMEYARHAYGHDVADRWLLKDDTEANEVMESDNEFHSVLVLAAKDF